MRIGIDIRPLMSKYRTGVGEYTYELLNAVLNIDTANQYFLFYNSKSNVWANIPHFDKPNVKYIAAHWPNKIFNATIKIFNRPKIDRLIGEKLDWFYSPNLNFTALSPDIKHALTIHDISFEYFPEFFTRKQMLWHRLVGPRGQCQRADLIFTPSANTERDLVEKYQIAKEKIRVIHPGPSSVFSDLDQDRLGLQKNQIRKKYYLPENFILFLGAIEPRKNIAAIISAFEKIYSSLPYPHALIIAGAKGWRNEEIYARANSSPLRDQIKFIGYVPAEEKPALFGAARLFVYPSFYEGFGFPVLEAMACGTPVITSDRSSLPEVVESAGYLINPNNAATIATGIQRILSDEKFRAHLITAGQIQAQKFSNQRFAQSWLTAIGQK